MHHTSIHPSIHKYLGTLQGLGATERHHECHGCSTEDAGSTQGHGALSEVTEDVISQEIHRVDSMWFLRDFMVI